MKKLLIAMMTLAMLAALFIPALAVTPSYRAPVIPKVPEVKVHVELPSSFWDSYFQENQIDTPDSVKLGVPEITNAHYSHKTSKSVLQIEWTEVEGAESYEVLITLANGETITYTETDTSVYDSGTKCPQSYSGEEGHIAYVRVRAVSGDTYGDWSAEETISCDSLHF